MSVVIAGPGRPTDAIICAANASQALKLVGESFPFEPGNPFLLKAGANHVGTYEFAARNIPTVGMQLAFEPHVVVLYPQYFDGTTMQSTGQSFVIKNSAPIAHNYRVAGNGQINTARQGLLNKGGTYTYPVNVDKQAITLNCDIHKWMTGYAMTFEHPYAAKTDKAGKFTIKNVPTGVELKLMAWHEAKRKFEPVIAGGNKIKLDKDGKLNVEFKIGQ